MSDFLSLHDAEQIAEEAAPVVKPGLGHVITGMIKDPIKTLGEAFAHPIQSYAVILAGLGGIYWAFNLAIAQEIGPALPAPALLAAIVLIGFPAGVAYLYMLTILLNWSSDVLGGQPVRKKIRSLLAYVGVPGLVAMVLFALPKLLIFGQSLFMPERSWMSANPVLVWGLWFGDALCYVWSLSLAVKGMKLMNGFTTARAVGALALPLIPVAFIGLLFLLIAGVGLFTAPAW